MEKLRIKKIKNIEHLMLIILSLSVMLSISALAQSIIDLGTTSNPQPTIIVDFTNTEDFGRVVSYSLMDSSNHGMEIEQIYHEDKIYKYKPTNILKNEEDYKFSITYEDDVGNQDSRIYLFRVEVKELNISIVEPSHGVTSKTITNITIKTHREVECKYVFNIPGLTYNSPALNKFEEQGVYHKIPNAQITEGTLLYVICNDTFTESCPSAGFYLHILQNPPSIQATLQPDELTSTPLLTTLSIETDQETECYYNLTTENKKIIGKTQDGFSTQHTIELNLEGFEKQEAVTYNLNIRCENKAELSSYKTLLLTIDLFRIFAISTIEYPEYTAASSTIVNLTTTREADYCIYSKKETMNNALPMIAHQNNRFSIEINDLEEGENTYYIECAGGIPQTISKQEITIIKDNMPPEIISAEITDVKEKRINLNIETNDTLSGIERLVFSLYFENNTFIENFTKDYEEDNKYKLYLEEDINEDEEYYLVIKAIDKVGLESDEIMLNFSLNYQRKLEDGSPCNYNYECISNFCNPEGICSQSTCDDSFLGPDETDVDCGGICVEEDKLCEVGKKCEIDEDCETGYCDPSTKRCKEKSTCENGIWDKEYETDIDCGKTCPPCSDNKKCETDEDCKSNNCQDGVCKEKDTDKDGITDSKDNCPFASNPEQEDFDNDNIGDACDEDDDNDGMPDSFEEQYNLNPKDASDADKDKDNDGLTNSEEYYYKTDPTNPDTDGDGISDSKEIEAGTDPLDPQSKPSSNLTTIVFVIIIIGFASFGIYFGYKHFGKKKPPLTPIEPPPTQGKIAKQLPTQKIPTKRLKTKPFIAKPRKVKTETLKEKMKIFDVFSSKKEAEVKKPKTKKTGITKKDKLMEKAAKEDIFIELKPEKIEQKAKQEEDVFKELAKFIKENKKKRKW